MYVAMPNPDCTTDQRFYSLTPTHRLRCGFEPASWCNFSKIYGRDLKKEKEKNEKKKEKEEIRDALERAHGGAVHAFTDALNIHYAEANVYKTMLVGRSRVGRGVCPKEGGFCH